jgi:hypothetical protein
VRCSLPRFERNNVVGGERDRGYLHVWSCFRGGQMTQRPF